MFDWLWQMLARGPVSPPRADPRRDYAEASRKAMLARLAKGKRPAVPLHDPRFKYTNSTNTDLRKREGWPGRS